MESYKSNARTINILDVPVADLSLTEMREVTRTAIAERKQLHIGVVNAAKLVNMRRDPLLREGVLESDVILADGMSVVWASKLLAKSPLRERVTGIDLMYDMFEEGKTRGYRVFLLGATEEVSETVAAKLAQDFPGVVLAGRRNGYFNDDDEQDIAESIRQSDADILLVAITSPKKEKFMARWSDYMGVPVIHGVGGSFDVMAGKVERAPEFWQRNGLEWLYRVKQEPGRLWKRYLVTNLLFCRMIIGALLKGRQS